MIQPKSSWTHFLERPLLGLTCAVLCLAPLCQARSFEPEKVLDSRLKAVFLYRFLQYVHWPESTPTETYSIQVLGDPEIFRFLKDIAKKKTVNNRGMEVYYLEKPTEIAQGHILFVSQRSWNAFQAAGLPQVGGHLLVVTDTVQADPEGAAFRFFLDRGRIHVEAFLSIIERRGHRVSSQLLKLALIREEG